MTIMNRTDNNPFALGVVFALGAGVFWGAMAVCVQYLFSDGSGLTPMGLVTVRLLFAGTCLVLLSGRRALAPFESLRDVVDVAVAGCFVFGGQFCFMQAIPQTGAGGATIILTTVPFWVAFWQAVVERKLPQTHEIACFVLAFLGVSLIVTHGDYTSLSFNPQGVCWAFASALLSAGYSIQPRRILKKAPVTPVMGWAMLAGGTVSSCLMPPWKITMEMTQLNLALLFVVVVLGTVAAFYLYMQAVRMISPVIVGLLGSSEPLSAYILSVAFLGVVVTSAELFGAALVLTAVAMVSLGSGRIRLRIRRRTR